MMTPAQCSASARYVAQSARLSLHPQAVALWDDPAPPEAIRPVTSLGTPIALCQGLALVKREGKTVYMERTDHSCWNPMVWLGLGEITPGSPAFFAIRDRLGIRDPEKAAELLRSFPVLPVHQGILMGPAETCSFRPDVILFPCDNNFQLRFFLMAIKHETGALLQTTLDPIDSCMHTIAEPILTGDYGIAIPDPGDQERALSGSNETILAVPISRLEELERGCRYWRERGAGYEDFHPQMQLAFSQPPFYQALFQFWNAR